MVREDIKILHLCRDSLFNEIIIELYENAHANGNEYVIISENSSSNKFDLPGKVSVWSKSTFKERIKAYKYVIVHSFTGANLWACSHLVDHVVAWCSWGGDLQGNHNELSDDKILEPATKALKERNTPARGGIKEFFYRFLSTIPTLNYAYYYFINKEPHRDILKKRALRNIDFVSTILPQEQKILQYFKNLNANYHWVNYGYLESFLGKDYANCKVENQTPYKRIFVGHSSFYSSNQLDAILRLASIDAEYKVFLPLAYGNLIYRDALISKVTSILKDKVELLLNVENRENYLKMISFCQFMILNTIKQQALGTLILGLFLGMKVFLNTKGVLFEFCISHGLKVFPLNTIEKELNTLMEEEEVEYNRAILEKIYGQKAVIGRIKSLIEKFRHEPA